VVDRDAIIIGDGGDFVSYAGRVIDSYEPGCWMDPGPFGCLGSGPGYALAAKLARPGKQVVLILGDGAFGFGGMEYDTLARHGVNVVGVMGNNGIWGLEDHPMKFLYGYSVAAELQPETPYEKMVEALGCAGFMVDNEDDLDATFEAVRAAGAEVLHDRIAPVHVSGHASQEELKFLLDLVQPDWFVPVHGEFRLLQAHARLAEALETARETVRARLDGGSDRR